MTHSHLDVTFFYRENSNTVVLSKGIMSVLTSCIYTYIFTDVKGSALPYISQCTLEGCGPT